MNLRTIIRKFVLICLILCSEASLARISGVNIPTNKKVSVGLTYIHGIGSKTALDICQKAGVDKDKRVNDLLETEVIQIREIIDATYKVEGELRRDISTNI